MSPSEGPLAASTVARDVDGAPRHTATHHDAPVQILELRSGRLRAALRVDLGGALAGLWFDGRPVLHGTEPQALASVDTSAAYACAPFTQELGNASMRWMDQTHHLSAHPAATPHAWHGVAWLRPWEVVAVSAQAAEIRYRHWADEHWPFAFDLHQVVALKGNALRLQLVLTNLHDEAQPAGLGWQLAFARGADTRVEFDSQARWELDATTRLPCGKVATTAADVADALNHDRAYEGWTGAMRVRHGAQTLRMLSSLSRLVVAGAARADHFRAGPVSHAPDAFHMGSPTANGLVVLPPMASLEATMRIEIGR